MSELQSSESYAQELTRSLSVWDNMLITMSAISPASSMFIITPTLILGLAGGSVLAMLIGAAIGILVAFCYAEVASAYPLTGGEYTWAARLLGKPVGFGVFLLTAVSAWLILAIFAVGLTSFLPVVSASLTSPWLVVVVLALTTLVASLTIKTNAVVTGICLAIELAAVAIVVYLGFTHVHQHVSVMFTPQTLSSHGTLTAVTFGTLFSLIPVALFAFNGYGNAVYYAEETHNPTKTMGRIILVSLAVAVVTLTLPVAAVVLGSPSLTALVASGDPYSYFLGALTNETVTKLVIIGIIIAIFNAMIAIQVGVARMLYSSARDRSWPDAIDRALGSIHPRTKSPILATAVVGAASMLIAHFMPFSWLVTATGAGIVFIYVAVAASALRVRSHGRQNADIYRMPLFPLPPIALLLFMAYALYESIRTDIGPVLVAAVTLLLGVAWYLLFIRPARGERWTLPEPHEEIPAKILIEP